jgi:TM2 domain-containing membrane protein YozV
LISGFRVSGAAIPKFPGISHGAPGNPLHAPGMEQKTTHSIVIGYLLWIFGFTGAHRFYYGRQISGIIWLLTLGLLGIGWFIDLFLIPSMDRAASRQYRTGPYDYSVAWILQTFLGVLGIHRFYLGKIGTGILWLLTGGLFGIGYIYDYLTLNGQIDECNAAASAG